MWDSIDAHIHTLVDVNNHNRDFSTVRQKIFVFFSPLPVNLISVATSLLSSLSEWGPVGVSLILFIYFSCSANHLVCAGPPAAAAQTL